MSSDLDPIVDIVISADGTPLSRTGFGTLAIICAQAASALSVDPFTSLRDVATEYGTNSPRHRAAAAAFAQNPRPKKIKFINTTLAAAQQVKLTVAAAAAGRVTSLRIRNPDGSTQTFTHTADGDDTTTTIATELASTISSGSTVFSAAGSGAVITITNDTNGQIGFFEPVSNLGTFLDETADPGFSAQLDAALVLDSDFYGVTCDVGSSACVLAVAAWALTNEKLAIISNSDAVELGASGTTGAALVATTNVRCGGLWYSRPWEYTHVAWLAARLLDPEFGRKTWAFAELLGCTPDTLTPAQRGYLAGDRWNYFVTVGGKNIVRGDAGDSLPGGGYTFGGTWIDEVHGDDWIRARSQEDIAEAIINAGIIEYDQAGINGLAGVLLARLKTAERIKLLLADTSSVEPPVLADVDPDDRQARTLRNLAASAKRSSAIHRVVRVNISLGY